MGLIFLAARVHFLIPICIFENTTPLRISLASDLNELRPRDRVKMTHP